MKRKHTKLSSFPYELLTVVSSYILDDCHSLIAWKKHLLSIHHDPQKIFHQALRSLLPNVPAGLILLEEEMSFLTSQSIEKKLSARQILLGAAFKPDFSNLRRYLLSICACDTGAKWRTLQILHTHDERSSLVLEVRMLLHDLFRHDEIHFRDKLEKFCANPRYVDKKWFVNVVCEFNASMFAWMFPTIWRNYSTEEIQGLLEKKWLSVENIQQLQLDWADCKHEQTVFLLKMGSQWTTRECSLVSSFSFDKSSLLGFCKKVILRLPAHPLLLSRSILTLLSQCSESELEFFVQAHVDEDCNFNEIIRKAKSLPNSDPHLLNILYKKALKLSIRPWIPHNTWRELLDRVFSFSWSPSLGHAIKTEQDNERDHISGLGIPETKEASLQFEDLLECDEKYLMTLLKDWKTESPQKLTQIVCSEKGLSFLSSLMDQTPQLKVIFLALDEKGKDMFISTLLEGGWENWVQYLLD